MKYYPFASTLLAALALLGAASIPARGRSAALPAPASSSPRLLVVCQSESSLAEVDSQRLDAVARSPIGPGSHEVAVSADGRLAFVSNYGSREQAGSTLSVVDVPAHKELRRVSLGALHRPHGLAVAGGKLYFTAESNQAIGRYDPVTDRVDWLLGLGQVGTHMLVLSPDGRRAYTANVGSGSVSAINLAAPPGAAPVRHIPVGPAPEGIALSPDGRELWVGLRSGGIVILDTATDHVVQTLTDAGSVARLQFSPDGKRVIAGDGRTDTVVVFDAAARTELKRIPVGRGVGALLVSPDSERAFVGVIGEDRVSVVDLRQLAVVGSIRGCPTPDGLAWAVQPVVESARPHAPSPMQDAALQPSAPYHLSP
jgi:YVTN family beta-propeller protein